MGSDLPPSRAEREEVIQNRLKLGLISPGQAKKMLEYSDISMTTLDEVGAKQDILNLIENQGQIEVIAEGYEDHTIRLKVINDFRKGTRYANLDLEIRQSIDALAKQHQEFLLSEQEASQGAMPAPAMPQPPQR